MDGLLIDSEPLWRRAEMACFSEVGIALTEADCRQTMGYRLSEVVDFWFNQQPWENYSPEQLETNILNQVIELIQTEGKGMPGLHHALDLFGKTGCQIALASSSDLRLIKVVLKALQIEQRFEVVKSAQHEEYGKPHPQLFISTAKALGVAPENCVVIEDSFHGIIAGKAAKMNVIAVPDPGDLKKPEYQAADLLISSLDELHAEHLKNLGWQLQQSSNS